MTIKHKTLLCAATSALALTAAGAVSAQSISQPIPPEHYSLDARGVDMVSGYFNFQTTEVAIGQPGDGGLALTRGRVQLGWRDSNQGTLEIAGSTYIVVLGLQSEIFTLSGSTYTPKSNSGATLTRSGSTFTFTTASGTVARYSTNYCYTPTGNACTTKAALYEIVAPNGEKTDYHYVTQSYVRSTDPNGDPVFGTVVRLQSITNNRGYQLHYIYKSNAMNTGGTLTNRVSNWLAVSSVTGVNNAVDYCAPTAFSCTYSRTWPSISYTSTIGGPITAATDQSGRVTQYIFGATNADITGIRYPGSTANDVTLDESGTLSRTTSLTDATGTWNYAYTDVGSTRTAVASGPLGQSQTVVTDLTVGRPTSITNALGETRSYQYDAQTRLTRATQPEGDYVEVTYDGRGNVTQTTLSPKTGGTEDDIVTSATYPSTCANPVICNLPTSTTDAAGNVTDYTWDSTHGGPLTVTLPAAGGGSSTRPQTRYAYAAQTAQFKNSSGVIVAAPTSVTLPVEVSACVTGSSCDATADEVLTTISYGVTTGVANNLNVASVSRGSGASPSMAVAAMTYTPDGDLATVDGPLSGTGDTTQYRYDASRQVVGVVGPDPDGGGAGLNRAQRVTYNDRGQPTLTEAGITAGYSDPNWAAFSPLLKSSTVYDDYGRPIENRQMSAAGVASGVQQVTYDAAGRVSCTAVRMNPATFGALPSSACTAATIGGFGPDRITQTTYDIEDRPLSVTSGLGTAAALTQSQTYTVGGQVGSLTDGDGNVSILEYDGFNRPVKLRYPNATGGGTSTTDFEAAEFDDYGRPWKSWNRDGELTTLSYDNLNRITQADAPAGTDDTYYRYDLLGRQTSVSTIGILPIVCDSTTTCLTWDPLSRLTSENTGVAMTYGYDPAGRMTSLAWPDGFAADYAYDLYGAVTAINQHPSGGSATQVAAYGWNDLGQPTTISRANGAGALTSRSYDAWGRLSGLVHDASGTAQDVAFGYGYNPADQIVGRSVSNETYLYGGSTANTAATYDGQNQIDAFGGVAVTHDSRGNVTGVAGNTYGYDPANRLTSASAGAGSATFAFDPMSRLSTSTVSGAGVRRQYSSDQLVAEYDVGTGVMTKRYIPGLGLDDVAVAYDGSGTSTRSWQLGDERGSVIALAGSTGTVSNINTYDEYGVPGSGNVGRFQYTGQQWLPEAGAYHYRARSYLPQIGRFLQADPIGHEGGQNLYAYVAGDPVNLVDPSGLACVEMKHLWRRTVTNADGSKTVSTFTTPAPSVCSDDDTTELDEVIVVGSRPQPVQLVPRPVPPLLSQPPIRVRPPVGGQVRPILPGTRAGLPPRGVSPPRPGPFRVGKAEPAEQVWRKKPVGSSGRRMALGSGRSLA